MEVGGTRGVYAAALRHQVISFYTAGAREGKAGVLCNCTRDVSIRGTGLVHLKLFDVDRPLEITCARKVYEEPVAGDHPIDKDIACTGSLEEVEAGKGDIGFELDITKVPTMSIQADLKNA